MRHPQMAKRVRNRFAYAAMSLFVVWHTLAMVVATAPESHITRAARAYLHPYLTLFRLDNHWGFFAPNVPIGYQFRYLVEDAAGQRHTFVPDRKRSRLLPTSIWFMDRYMTVMTDPASHGQAAGAALCREHADLKPVAVTLIEVEQRPFLPSDRLGGKHPLDPEFVNVTELMKVPCRTP